MELVIFDDDYNLIILATINDGAKLVKEVMPDKFTEYFECSFVSASHVFLKRGHKTTFNGKYYAVYEDVIPTVSKENGGFYYTATFVTLENLYLCDSVLWFDAAARKEPDFTITGTADLFLQNIIENLKQTDGRTFVAGEMPSGVVSVHFENAKIKEGLDLIAEAFKTEWWIDGLTINISECRVGTELDLYYDLHLDEISASNSSKELLTKIYAYGSTRNVPLAYYSTVGINISTPNRLRLPSGHPFIALNPGERSPKEGVVIFEDIYPRRIGTVSEVRSFEVTDNGITTTIYFIKDNSVNFDITSIIPGETLKAVFQSGYLNGRDFSIAYHSDTKEYEIIYTSESVVIPNPSIAPQAGDTFILYNYDITKFLDHFETTLNGKVDSVSWNDITFFYKDNTTTFNNSNWINGCLVTFTSGDLIGQSLQFFYNDVTGTFESDLQETSDHVPSVGDTFTLSGISIPVYLPQNQYILDAEHDLLDAATNWLNSQENEFVWDVKTRSIYCEVHNIDLPLGQRVYLKSEVFDKPFLRIRKFEKSMMNQYDATYTIGDSKPVSRLKALEKAKASQGKNVSGGSVTNIYNSYYPGGVSNPYVLPIASSEVLGGVKIGNNLAIDPETGVLNANAGGGGGITIPKLKVWGVNHRIYDSLFSVRDRLMAKWESENKEFLNYNPEIWTFRYNNYRRRRKSAMPINENLELLPNGSFDNGEDYWTVTNGAISDGSYTIDGNYNGNIILESLTTFEKNKYYRITINVSAYSNGTIQVALCGMQRATTLKITHAGIYTGYVYIGANSPANTLALIATNIGAVTATIDSISVVEVTGSWASTIHKSWKHEPHLNGIKFPNGSFYSGHTRCTNSAIESTGRQTEFLMQNITGARISSNRFEVPINVYDYYYEKFGSERYTDETDFSQVHPYFSYERKAPTLRFAIVIDNPDAEGINPKLIGPLSDPIMCRMVTGHVSPHYVRFSFETPSRKTIIVRY